MPATPDPGANAAAAAEVLDFSPGLVRHAARLLRSPGVVADHLLTEADHADRAAREIGLGPAAGTATRVVEVVCADLHAYAAHLRAQAPRYPSPPREPAP